MLKSSLLDDCHTGTSAKDLHWLKMRAYTQGLERIRAKREQRKAEAEAARFAQYSVPTDKVPQGALDYSNAQAGVGTRVCDCYGMCVCVCVCVCVRGSSGMCVWKPSTAAMHRQVLARACVIATACARAWKLWHV